MNQNYNFVRGLFSQDTNARNEEFATKKGTSFKSLLLLVAFAFFASISMQGQVAVTVINPANTTPSMASSYTSLALALTDLNAVTAMSGPITLNLAAGSEIAPSTGFSIGSTSLNPVLSSTNKVTIFATPGTVTLNAGLGTVLMSSSAATNVLDGIMKIRGADWITIDGLTLTDGNDVTSPTAMMEFGLGIFKAGDTDGASNNTIKNCTINLPRQNNAGGNGVFPNGSVCIAMVNSIDTMATTALVVLAPSGSSSNNNFFTNTTNGGNFGILLAGYLDIAPFAFADTNNNVGGSSLATGNTILNFGGTALATNTIAGIRTNYQYNVNISYNTVNNNNGSGLNHPNTLRGIYLNTALGASATVNNNIVTVTCGATTSSVWGIDNLAGASVGSGSTIAINNNTVTLFYPTATTGSSYAIQNEVACDVLNMNNNIIASTTNTASGSVYSLYNSGAVVTTMNINGNSFANTLTLTTAISSSIRGVYCTAAATTCALSISSNNFNSFSYTGAAGGTGVFYGIYNTSPSLTSVISNNNYNNLSLKTTGAIYLIYNSNTAPANGSKTVQNNTIVTGLARSIVATTAAFYGYYDYGSSPITVSYTVSGNNFSNINTNTTTTGAFYGFYVNDNSNAHGLNFYNNTLSNITRTATTGAFYGFYLGGFGGTITAPNEVYGNTVSGVTSTSTSTSQYGMYVTTPALYVNVHDNIIQYNAINGLAGQFVGIYGAGTTNLNKFYNNTINNNTSTSTAAIIGLYIAGGTQMDVYKNSISTLSSAGNVWGVYVNGGTLVNVYDHRTISGLSNYSIYGLTSSGATSVVEGLRAAGGTTVNFYKNNLYLLNNSSASTTATAALVNGISLSGGTTVNVYNNLVSALTAPTVSYLNAINGINVSSAAATTSYNLYNNTIYLNAAGGTNFGTTGVNHAASATATTATLNLRNNIIVNTSTPTGTGIVTALRRSAAATLGNFATTSNNNMYFAGAPSATRTILYDGTNAYQTYASYFTAVGATSESSSFQDTAFSAASFFGSTTTYAANYLQPASGITTQAESGGPSIALFTNDYNDVVRNATFYDLGAWEFSGITPAPSFSGLTVTPTGSQCTTVPRAIAVTVTTPSGTITGVSLNYTFNAVAQTPIAMTNISGNIWTGTIPASLPTNANVTWSLVATNSLPLSTTFVGAAYRDNPLLGILGAGSASPTVVCNGSSTALTAVLASANSAAYSAPPAVSNPTTDEDLGNVTIKQGTTTILDNTSAINNLTGTIGAATGTAGSYSNFTSFGPYNLTAGQIYNFSLTSLQATSAYGNSMAIYIDFNRNGVFTDVGEAVYVAAATTSGTHIETGSISIPAYAFNGITRMRVICNEGLITGPTMTVGYGEYEEYTLNISSASNGGGGSLPVIASYSWSNGTSVVGTTNPLTVSPTVNTTYIGTMTDNLGCSITTPPITINVNALPSAPIATNATQCGTQLSTARVASSTGLPLPTFVWYAAQTGGTALQTNTSTTYLTALSATTTLYVSEYNGTCESLRTPVVFTVVAPPTVTITPSTASFCGIGGATTLTATSPDSGMTFAWTSLNATATLNTTTGATVTATLSETSDFMVTGTATNATCLPILTYASIGVYPLPSATVTSTAQGVCPGTSATIGSGLVAGNFAVTSIPYVEFLPPANAVVVATGGVANVPLSGGSLDDGGWSGLPIGFNFNFFGTNFSTISAGTNGLLMFGTPPGYTTAAGNLGQYSFNSTPVVFPNTLNPGNVIALMAADQYFGNGTALSSSSTLTYWTQGYAPNRIFVIEYSKVDPCCSDNPLGFTAQARLYETLGTVDIAIVAKTGTGASTVGLQDATKTIGAVAPGRQAFTSTITTPEAWRFAPPSNYATRWYANGVLIPSRVGLVNPGTNVFNLSVAPTATTTYSISYTNQTTGCANAAGSAQVVMSVLGDVIPAGINTIASATSICTGQAVNFSLSYTGITDGIVFQWQNSTDGGTTWNNIASANATTYSTVPTAVSKYRCKMVACNGAPGYSSVASVGFNNTIATTTPGTRCGTGTAILGATGSAGTTINWYANAAGGTSLGTGTSFVTPSITANTTYYAAAETSTPPGISLGLGATLSSSTAQSFFPGGWGGAKTQYIIQASELLAAGISAGNITSLGFEPTTSGQTYQGFSVSLGATSSSAMTTSFESTGLSQVYLGTLLDNGFTPVANTLNVLAFGTGAGSTSAFNWNGTSNIVVSISWSSVPGAFTSTATTMKVDDVGFVSSAYYQADSLTPEAMLAIASGSGTGSLRPRFTINCQVICSSPRVAVLATVTTPPTIALSGNPATICSEQSTAAVTVVTGRSDYDTYVWTPSSTVTGNATTGWVFNPLTTTSYSLAVSQSTGTLPCATTTGITVNVNPTPSVITIAPTPAIVCVDNILPLVATGGTISPNYISSMDVLPTDFALSTANSATVTANSTYYSEGTGSVLFNVSSVSSTANYSLNTDLDMSAATSATLTFSHIAAMEGSFFSYDYGYVEYTVDGGVNWISFSPSDYVGTAATSVFNTSARFSTLSYADWTTQFTLSTSTPGVGPATSLWKSETFNIPASALTSTQFRVRFRYTTDSSTNYNGWFIDNVRVNKSAPTTMVWSPVTNLYSDAAATTPYTGTNAATVYFKSSSAAPAATYTATASSALGCTRTKTVPVTVNANTTLSLTSANATQTVCVGTAIANIVYTLTNGTGVTATLPAGLSGALVGNTYTISGIPTAAGAISVTGTGLCLSSAALTGSVSINPNTTLALASGTATQTVCYGVAISDVVYTVTNGTGVSATLPAGLIGTYAGGTYTISGTPTASGTITVSGTGLCLASAALTGVITVNQTFAPVASAAQSVCYASTIANLTVTATLPQWYAASTGGTALATTTPLVNGTTYYVSQTLLGCEGPRTAVTVTIITTPAPTGLQFYQFCPSGNATLNDITATLVGTLIKWYATPSGGTQLASTTALAQGYYWATQTANGCESPTRFAVFAISNATAAPSSNPLQQFCISATVASLTANGSVLQWYAASTGGAALASTASIATGTYYVSQTSGGCESPRTAVAVIVTVVSNPIASAQTFCNSGTVAGLTATGSGLNWYSTSTGGSALASSTALATGTYYVSQTINSCEGSRTAVVVTVNSTLAPTSTAQTFCNSGTVASLTATGTALNWYASLTGGAALANTTALATGTYYVSQTVNACESTRTAVSVTVNTTSAPNATATQTFCNSATVAALTATGTGLNWYASATGGTALVSTTALTTGTTYYVSQTISGCQGPRTAVSVIINSTPAPTGAATQSLSSLLTVGNIVVAGTNVVWYSSSANAASGTNPLPNSTLLANTTYYATQTIAGCASTTSLAVTITTLANQDFDMTHFSYYPNPVIDLLNVSYSQDMTNVKVFNMIGQQLLNKDVNATTTQIDMSSYANGAYFIQVSTENAMKTVRVIKK